MNEPTREGQAVQEPIAIIGIGCMFPKAGGPGAYWANIREGVDAITEVPATHWKPEDYFDADPGAPDMTYGRRGGYLEPVDFDPLEFGIAPRDIEATDTSQLFGLAVAKQAMQDAGYGAGGKSFDRERVAVILGVTGALELVIPLGARLGHPIWRRALDEAGVDPATAADVVQRIGASYVGWQENSFPGLLGNVVAGRIANRLDLHGTNCVVDAACASSLSAVHMAALELESGRADMAIAGGVDTFNDIFMHMCFSKTPALSPTGDARPFDQAADGTILGEGLGMVVLKRLGTAERDGDRIYAVLRGVGSSSDGKGNAIYAPSAEGQARALRLAYQRSGISPATVELLEAHGTGTKVGDATEIQGLGSVYRAAGQNAIWCAIGSVKSMIGHTKAAAGIAGMIKAALALHHKVLPPTIKVQKPAEALATGATPFYVNSLKRVWMPRPGHPRRAAVSAFGFGGSNFHCVLEEHGAEAQAIDWDGSVAILALSGETRETVGAALRELPLAAESWDGLCRLAAETCARFDGAQPCRLLIVLERSGPPVAELLRVALERLEGASAERGRPGPQSVYLGAGPAPGKLAALFPGQGAQYVGMLRDLQCQFPQMQRALAEADSAFGEQAVRLSDRIYPHPAFDAGTQAAQEAALTATDVAQPAIGAVSLGLLRVLEHFRVQFDAAAGHSYGELPALCAAGRLAPRDLHRLSLLRGRLMAEGDGDRGAMLAVMAEASAVEAFVREHGLDLVIANRNAPRQTVLSGSTAEIERAAGLLKPGGLRGQKLAVAAAFHSPLVARAAEPFGRELAETPVGAARFPVYSNTTAEPYPEAAEAARALLANQLAAPVDFLRSVQNLHAAGVRSFVELGPGRRLGGLAADILAGQDVLAISVDASAGQGHGVADLARALAQLAARGHRLDLSRWNATAPSVLEGQKPAKKRGMTISLSGANHVAPRPKAPPRQPSVPAQGTLSPGRILPPRSALPVDAGEGTAPKTLRSAEPGPMAWAPEAALEVNLPTKPHSAPPPSPAPAGEESGVRADSPVSRPDQALLAEAFRASESSLNALVRLQEQTADLHRRFLEGQMQATLSFQSLVERQQQMFASTLGLAQSLPPAAAPSIVERNPRLARVPATAHGSPQTLSFQPDGPERGPGRTESVGERLASPSDVGGKSDFHPVDRPGAAAAAMKPVPADLEPVPPVRAASPADKSASNGSGAGLAKVVEVLLAAVAEKTGYPVEMLELSMGLDGDLGIDSIKRVEILSALQDRLPESPVVKPEHLGRLQTLGQIAEFLAAAGAPAFAAQGSRAAVPAAGPALPGVEASSNGSGAGLAKVVEVLLAAVAEKTGYPVEMLELSMGLDGDLGIDSIKRVEILSALQDRLPESPVVKPEHLGRLQTLGQIAEFLAAASGPAVTVTVPEPKAAIAPVPAALEPKAASSSAQPAAPAMTAPALAAAPARGLARYELRRRKLEAAGSDSSWAWDAGALVWVTRTEDGLSEALAAELRTLGVEAEEIRLDATGRIVPERLAGLVVAAPREGGGDELLHRAFALVRAAGPTLLKSAEHGAALLATVSRLDGSFGLGDLDPRADAATGGLAGLVKSLQHEWPQVRCRALDLDRGVEDLPGAARAILKQLTSGSAVECGIDGHGIWTLELEPVELPPNEGALFGPQDVILVTGGARGVTAEAAVALARAGAKNLALFGRSPAPTAEPEELRGIVGEAALKRAILEGAARKLAPRDLEAEYHRVSANREILGNIGRMERAGARVVYRPVDLRDARQVLEGVQRLSAELGPITGLVHGAGVLADSAIENKSEQDFARVYATKVLGLRSLLAALGDAPLKAMALFSSSTARFGRKGQVDYAVANETLNKLAQQQARQRPGCSVVSVNWGPWDGGMVTPQLRDMFAREGVEVIGLDAGAGYLVDELAAARGAVEVLVLGKGSRLPASAAATAPRAGQALPLRIGGLDPGSRPAGSVGSRLAAPCAARPELPVVVERRVDLETHPVLQSHVLGGKAVLPVALMVEWLAHGALHGNPGLRFCGFEELRVFKGVLLEPGGAVTLRICAGKAEKRTEHFEVLTELCSGGGSAPQVLHARARIVVAGRLPAAEPVNEALALAKYEHSLEEVYGRLLFHGPALQGIEAVEGCAAAGIEASASTAPPARGWMRDPLRSRWIADPMALDCAFQLMILWSIEQRGLASLPTYAGSYRQYRGAFPDDGVHIQVRVTKHDGQRALADIDWLDRNGELVARLRGYECVMDVSLSEAFRQNELDASRAARA